MSLLAWDRVMLVFVNIILSYTTLVIVSFWSACRLNKYTINMLSIKHHHICHIRGRHGGDWRDILSKGQRYEISVQILTWDPPDLSMSDWIIKFDIIFMKAEALSGTILSPSRLPFTQLTAGVTECPFIFQKFPDDSALEGLTSNGKDQTCRDEVGHFNLK